MTQTASHTPRPWQLYSPHPSEQYVDQIDDGGDHRKSIFRIHHDDEISQPEAEANARLIALAPDFYSFAKYLDSVAPCQPGDGSAPLEDDELIDVTITGKALKDLRTAIAKAENRGQPC